MIEFKRKYSMTNGNKLTKSNWRNVIAVSDRPCTNVIGVNAIDKARELGEYYEKWKLVHEYKGFIFREVNHNGGINGHHKTFKKAISAALELSNIRVFIEE